MGLTHFLHAVAQMKELLSDSVLPYLTHPHQQWCHFLTALSLTYSKDFQGSPGPHSVDQAGPELTDPPAPAS